jgi:hypothetical protein
MTLLLLSLLACDGPAEDTGGKVEDTDVPVVDADGDGVPEGADCDDTDPYTYPGARELPYDGVDQDCDGADLVDNDGDGYVGEDGGGDDCNDANPDVHPGATPVCGNLLDETCVGEGWTQYDCDGDGYDDVDDCAAEDPAIHPDAEDAWYDGVDSDCDLRDDYDQDGDGEATVASGGTDCDDLDAAINTAGDEAWNGVDDDCTGGVDDLDNRDATGSWSGDSGDSEAQFAGAFASVEDLDGDGLRDVIVGVPGYADSTGRAYVLPSGAGRQVPSETALATINTTSGYLGTAVTGLRGADGGGRVAVAEAGAASIYLFDAETLTGGAALTGADADASITSSAYYLGGALAPWDDGAGGQSLLVSSYEVEGSGTYVGLFPGAALVGAVGTDAATWAVELTSEVYDTTVLGDLDGDGLAELGIGLPGFSGTHRLNLYLGDGVAAGDTDAVGLTGFTGRLASGAAGDLDGDGYGDLLVSDLEAAGAGSAAGVVWVLGGDRAVAGGVAADLARASISGNTDGAGMHACAGHADLDGDGVIEVLVCTPGDGVSGGYGGVAWVSAAALNAGGDHAPGTDGPSWVSRSYDDLFGADALPEDIDGDGDMDLWISAPGTPGALYQFLQD